MTTLQDVTTQSTGPTPPERKSIRSGIIVGLIGMAVFAAIVAVAHNMRAPGSLDTRIKNPNITGAPRPVPPLFNDPNWIVKIQLGTIVMFTICVIAFVVYWRRHPKHPVLLMILCATIILWMDPIMNWAPYAVYNPKLWHLPETWFLASLSPTLEPFVVLPYATFYVGVYFPAIWTLRRIQRGRPVTSFFWRHPLISLGIIVYIYGFIYDAILKVFCVRAGLYIYDQVIPFGSIFTGQAYQFPLIWESSLVTLVMIPAAILLYRDDTGHRVAEKLAQRFRGYQKRPALATFSVMLIALTVAYAAYGAGFWIIRASKSATSVACPWPYPEAKVYDPNGFYAKAGQPGPYFPGIWSTYMSAQPDGRPNTPTNPDGRCSPQNVKN